ncbi:MAG TPA: hypothetical protein VF818_11030 [Ktedonobacterales bacterium]
MDMDLVIVETERESAQHVLADSITELEAAANSIRQAREHTDIPRVVRGSAERLLNLEHAANTLLAEIAALNHEYMVVSERRSESQ